MSKHTDEDLFASSTMSIGDHLEELRHSLFLALMGLLVGFGFGLFLANHVVMFIQTPLKGALTEYYSRKAIEELQEKYGGKAPPELLNMITKEGKIPDTLDVDPFSFVDGIRQEYPGEFNNIQLKRHVFLDGDLEIEEALLPGSRGNYVSLSREIRNGSTADADSPTRVVWDVLSDEHRAQVERLADTSGTTEKERSGLTAEEQTRLAEEDRAKLVGILNVVIDQRDLQQKPALASDAFVGSLETAVRSAVKELRKELSEEFDADKSRRLNRLLVASVYPSHIRSPHVNVISVTVWKPKEVRVQTLNAHEAFMIWVKAAVISGLVIASPWIFWQVWIFVAAGLYAHERKYVWVFLPFSLILFLAGAGMAFFFVFRPVLNFLFTFNKAMNIDPDPRISEWLGFVLFLPIGFGVSFQLPLVMLFLHRIGIFTVESYLSKWRIAILVIFVLAMLLTPADPVSMLLMAIPLTVLYFGGIGLCKWLPRIGRPAELPDEP